MAVEADGVRVGGLSLWSGTHSFAVFRAIPRRIGPILRKVFAFFRQSMQIASCESRKMVAVPFPTGVAVHRFDVSYESGAYVMIRCRS